MQTIAIGRAAITLFVPIVEPHTPATIAHRLITAIALAPMITKSDLALRASQADRLVPKPKSLVVNG